MCANYPSWSDSKLNYLSIKLYLRKPYHHANYSLLHTVQHHQVAAARCLDFENGHFPMVVESEIYLRSSDHGDL